MNWYLVKIVYRIICGSGQHTAQFDEQLRLIGASGEWEAFSKAVQIGRSETETFCNTKEELVQWQFINVAALYPIGELTDGAELYSRIEEREDGEAYVQAVHQKAAFLCEQQMPLPFHLTT